MPTALTRPLSPLITECELIHISRKPIDLEKAEKRANKEAIRQIRN